MRGAHSWLLPATGLVCVLAAQCSAAGERSAQAWLEQMNQAFVSTSYDGIFSYYSGNDLSTLRVVHTVRDGIQRERLVHLNGAPREIVRTGDQVVCILQPGDEILALEGSIPSGPFARAFSKAFEGASEFYSMSLDGVDRVADREAVRVAVMPRDEDRYGFRLWLDAATGLLLRSELIDMKGAKLEIFQFAIVRIGEPVSDADLTPDAREGAHTSRLELDAAPAPAEDHPQWQAGWLPAGFKMAAADIRRTPESSEAVHTLMYSDGLAVFSVFIESLSTAGAANLISRSGATVAVTETVAGGPDQSNHLVTVVGEIPTATAQRIARSVHYPGDD